MSYFEMFDLRFGLKKKHLVLALQAIDNLSNI